MTSSPGPTPDRSKASRNAEEEQLTATALEIPRASSHSSLEFFDEGSLPDPSPTQNLFHT